MTDMATWATDRCEAHDMTSCADCLERAWMRRTPDGALAWDNDCTVATYTELTGAPYPDAVEALKAAGLVPGRGLHRNDLVGALRAAGYQVREMTRTLGLDHARTAPGRWYVSGGKRNGLRHSWTIIDGTERRGLPRGTFSYYLYQVTAPAPADLAADAAEEAERASDAAWAEWYRANPEHAPAPEPVSELAAKRSPKEWGNPVWRGRYAHPHATADGTMTYVMEHAASTTRDRRTIEAIQVTNGRCGQGRGWDLVVHGDVVQHYAHKTAAQRDAEQLLDA